MKNRNAGHCPDHGAKRGACDALGVLLDADPWMRAQIADEVENWVWSHAVERMGRDWYPGFLEAHDACDCWKKTGRPYPSLARSALLFHMPLVEAQGRTAGMLFEEDHADAGVICPAMRGWVRAENTAQLGLFRALGDGPKGVRVLSVLDPGTQDVEAPSCGRDWFRRGDHFLGRTVRYQGIERLLQYEALAMKGKEAEAAVREVRKLDPCLADFASRLLAAVRRPEPEGGVHFPATLDFLAAKSGSWRN